METHTKLWNRDYTRAFLGNFLVTLVANGLPGVFTLFLLARGGTDLDSGIATAAFYIVSLIACPIAGWIVDNRDRKKLLLLALIGMVAIPWVFLIVPWIVGLILTRTLHGIMESVSLTTITTNAYDALDEAHFSEGVGCYGFGNSLGTAFGPAINLFMYRRFGEPGLFAACSALCALALLLMLRFHYMPIKRSEKRMRDERLRYILFERKALPASALDAVYTLMSGAVNTYIAVYLVECGNLVDAGRYFFVQAIGSFTSRLFIGRISAKYGEAPLVAVSALSGAAGMSLVLFASSVFPIYAGAILMGIGIGFNFSGMQIMSVRIVKPERRGAASSTYSCGWNLSAGFGGLIAGVLVTLTNYKTMFICMMAVYPAYAVLYFTWGCKQPSAFRVWKRKQEGAKA